jgi:hypothetical protein
MGEDLRSEMQDLELEGEYWLVELRTDIEAFRVSGLRTHLKRIPRARVSLPAAGL